MRSVSCDIGMGAVGHSTEYNAKERKVYWKIKKFNGGTEQTLRTKVIYNNICLLYTSPSPRD